MWRDHSCRILPSTSVGVSSGEKKAQIHTSSKRKYRKILHSPEWLQIFLTTKGIYGMYASVYILAASLLLMKQWDLASISWLYCYIVFRARVPEVTQTNPLRANTGLCFLFTRVNAVLFSVTGPRGARCVHAAYSFGSDTWDSAVAGGAHPHPSLETWRRRGIDYDASIKRTQHIQYSFFRPLVYPCENNP